MNSQPVFIDARNLTNSDGSGPQIIGTNTLQQATYEYQPPVSFSANTGAGPISVAYSVGAVNSEAVVRHQAATTAAETRKFFIIASLLVLSAVILIVIMNSVHKV